MFAFTKKKNSTKVGRCLKCTKDINSCLHWFCSQCMSIWPNRSIDFDILLRIVQIIANSTTVSLLDEIFMKKNWFGIKTMRNWLPRSSYFFFNFLQIFEFVLFNIHYSTQSVSVRKQYSTEFIENFINKNFFVSFWEFLSQLFYICYEVSCKTLHRAHCALLLICLFFSTTTHLFRLANCFLQPKKVSLVPIAFLDINVSSDVIVPRQQALFLRKILKRL